MDSMSEQWWEKKLNIRTAGKVDHFIEEACNPYEPTDYCILEALAESGYISSGSHVLDYGCGKGRTAIFLSFRTGCRATGIEFDQELCEEAVKNLEQCKLPEAYKKGIRFVCEDARKYEIEGENCFYFFNPFAEEVLRAVLAFISSIHLRRRSCGPSLAKYSSPIMRIRDRCICSFTTPLRLRWLPL